MKNSVAKRIAVLLLSCLMIASDFSPSVCAKSLSKQIGTLSDRNEPDTYASEFYEQKVYQDSPSSLSYYSTDIVTTVNGAAIDTISIDGKTLINVEDLIYHGFDVEWNQQARTLRATYASGVSGGGPSVKKSSLAPGTYLGKIQKSDIVTYLDGKKITSYNNGGRTYICAEEMDDYGYDVVWDGEKRTLSVQRSISFTVPKLNYNYGPMTVYYDLSFSEFWMQGQITTFVFTKVEDLSSKYYRLHYQTAGTITYTDDPTCATLSGSPMLLHAYYMDSSNQTLGQSYIELSANSDGNFDISGNTPVEKDVLKKTASVKFGIEAESRVRYAVAGIQNFVPGSSTTQNDTGSNYSALDRFVDLATGSSTTQNGTGSNGASSSGTGGSSNSNPSSTTTSTNTTSANTPAINTAVVTVSGKEETYYLGKSYASSSDSSLHCFEFYTLPSGNEEYHYLSIMIRNVSAGETRTNKNETSSSKCTISYMTQRTPLRSTSPASNASRDKVYYSVTITSGGGSHYEGYFDAYADCFKSEGSKPVKLTGRFNMNLGEYIQAARDLRDNGESYYGGSSYTGSDSSWEDSGSSGSSGNTETRYCSKCGGNGRCPNPDCIDGYVYHENYGHSSKRLCSICHGENRCPVCHGTGRK